MLYASGVRRAALRECADAADRPFGVVLRSTERGDGQGPGSADERPRGCKLPGSFCVPIVRVLVIPLDGSRSGRPWGGALESPTESNP